jgi:hypothetical protein
MLWIELGDGGDAPNILGRATDLPVSKDDA